MLRALALLAVLAVSAHAQPTPVTVLHNARIYTVNPDQPTAEALAFAEGRLLALGTEDEVLEAYPDARRLDARGRTVVPGLIDAHAHLMNLGLSLLRADLAGTTSKDEILERLTAFAAGLPEGAWLTGRGWDQNAWPAAADGSFPFPTRADLDAAFPERPVWLTRVDGHAAWANTAALRAAGLDPDAPAPEAPEGGAIRTDAEGRPTGVFIDRAMGLVANAIPESEEAELEEALERALEATASHGLTGVHDAGADLATFRRYERFIEAGRFPLRVYAMIDGPGATFAHVCEERGLPVPYAPSERLRVQSVKVYVDGALGSRGAALLEDYADAPGERGLLFMRPDSLRAFVADAMRCGLQVNTHAIGDRGNRTVLDAYEAALAETGGGPGRHRIEHAQVVVAPDDIARFAPLGVIASVQPTHATSDMPWAEARVGPERIRGAYAWRSFLESGTRLALGSDFPVERVPPLLGFHAAVTRQDAGGQPPGGWYPEQALTREEALRGFTLDAAYAAFMEDEVGSLEAGKRADFVVLSRDVMAVPESEILGTEVVATFLDGEPVFGGL
jgi:predicted amidohydrolase YtcJ